MLSLDSSEVSSINSECQKGLLAAKETHIFFYLLFIKPNNNLQLQPIKNVSGINFHPKLVTN